MVGIAAISAAIALSCVSDALAAESFPAKPIRVIVTFPPGGSSDLMARAVQPHLEQWLGQPIIIEQGIEMLRPSRIHVSATLDDATVTKVFVGGRTIPVATGRFFLP